MPSKDRPSKRLLCLHAAAQFCRVFGSALKLKPFSMDQLENALLSPLTHQLFVAELMYRLLTTDGPAQPDERELETWHDRLTKKLAANYWCVAMRACLLLGQTG